MSKHYPLNKFVDQKEIDYVIKNYGILYNKNIASDLGWSISKLTRMAKRLGLKSNLKHQEHNSNFENILLFSSPNIIYGLGFIWADGHIKYRRYKDKKHYLSTTLSVVESDFDNICEIFEEFGNAKITHGQRQNHKPFTTWSLHDSILANYLVGLDYADKSSTQPIKILDQIPENLRYYWWRGYYDGDGHNQISKAGCPSVHLSSGYKQSWDFLNMFLPDIDFKILRNFREVGGSNSVAFISSEEALKFLNYIYQNRDQDKIGLDRKYEKFLICKGYKRKSDFKYVYYRGDTNRWVFSIRNKISKTFKSEEEAIKSRDLFLISYKK